MARKHGPWPEAWPLARSARLDGQGLPCACFNAQGSSSKRGPWPEAWPLARCMALGPTRSLRVEKWRYAEAAPTAKKNKLHCPCATLPLGSCPEALAEKEHRAVGQVQNVPCATRARVAQQLTPKEATKERISRSSRGPRPSMGASCSPMPTQGLRRGRSPAEMENWP